MWAPVISASGCCPFLNRPLKSGMLSERCGFITEQTAAISDVQWAMWLHYWTDRWNQWYSVSDVVPLLNRPLKSVMFSEWYGSITEQTLEICDVQWVMWLHYWTDPLNLWYSVSDVAPLLNRPVKSVMFSKWCGSITEQTPEICDVQWVMWLHYWADPWNLWCLMADVVPLLYRPLKSVTAVAPLLNRPLKSVTFSDQWC
jgi:hypothetical protein